MDRHDMKRPPAMGEMKRTADAQALTLRAQLRTVMRLRAMTTDDVAARARLDAQHLAAFLAGASINPRWQEKLAQWLETEIGDHP
ncbi:MAG TPA: hypothetical protein VKQ30_02585 [Ktedonobacterales bacterium]|jgi:hypothetical protein|nr:hypothetical protein [Ktedonobacterales bacterium]